MKKLKEIAKKVYALEKFINDERTPISEKTWAEGKIEELTNDFTYEDLEALRNYIKKKFD